jgi:hypothetical protein
MNINCRYLIFFLQLLFIAVKGQVISPQILASGGSYVSAVAFSNSFTIGEMTTVETISGNSFFLTQGFQQCNPVLSTDISNKKSLDFSIYPNPSSGKFYLNPRNNSISKVEVYSITGEKLTGILPLQNEFSLSILDLSNFSNGIYFLQVTLSADGMLRQLYQPITLSH